YLLTRRQPAPTLFPYTTLFRSSGERRQQGSMTKAGHTHARRALVEGAWAYRYPAKVSRHLQLRLEKHSTIIQDISWKAQVRLCQDRKSTRLNSSHRTISYAVFC